jgi:hypothetical protein
MVLHGASFLPQRLHQMGARYVPADLAGVDALSRVEFFRNGPFDVSRALSRW